MKKYETTEPITFPAFSAHVERLEELYTLNYPTRCVALTIAADFTTVDSEGICSLAQKLIDRGLAYIQVWGPGCSDAHVDFDTGSIKWQEENKRDVHVTSTDQEGESLEETIWSALFCPVVSEDVRDKCSTVIVSVDDVEWKRVIEKSLGDIGAFSAKLTGE